MMQQVKTLDLGELQQQVLLFGGPYSNLEATRAMRTRVKKLGIAPSQVICTGDLVAYCASPAETVDLVREWDIQVVMGNCEESLAKGSTDCGCGFEQDTACALLSDDWFSFAHRHVDEGHRKWMGKLPSAISFRLNGLNFHVVHGTPSKINRFIFPSTSQGEKLSELELTSAEVVIGGHCGIPFGQKLGERYWLNTGAIGLPANDGTTDGWYLLLTPLEDSIEVAWHRLSYDHNAACRSMLNSGLNHGYAEALLSGLWPSMDVLPEEEKTRQGIRLELHPLGITLLQCLSSGRH